MARIDGPHTDSPHQPLSGGHSESHKASFAQWLVSFALPLATVFYLGLRGGGYELVVRDQLGALIWWSVFVIAAFGLVPRIHVTPGGKIVLILLTGLAVWTCSSSLWSESAERSIDELSRVLTYMGVFLLFSLLHTRSGSKMTIAAVGTAIVLISGFALASRLHPPLEWGTVTAEAIPSVQSRLSYPLGYWNGLAALCALGIPLMMWAACCSRRILTRSLAGATVPLLSLTLFFTLSRGGTLAVVAGLLVLFGLLSNKGRLLSTAAIVTVGSAVCIVAAMGREELMDGGVGTLATTQGWEMLAVLVIACAITALLLALLPLAHRRSHVPDTETTSGGRRYLLPAIALLVLVLTVAFIASGRASDLWQEFKQPDRTASSSTRFEAASGNGRYQYWSAAVQAARTEPLLGIGPEAFEFWWDREGTLEGSVRHAHSLYLESLAELGLPGFLLVLGIIVTPIAVASRKAIDGREGTRRGAYAGALAAMTAFAISAAVDWVWELAVLPVCFFILAAAVTGDSTRNAPLRAPRIRRCLFSAAALLCVVAISIPLASASLVAQSQQQAAAGEFSNALNSAAEAHSIEPYAATPYLQKALVQERTGDLAGAVYNATNATRREPTNWRAWLVLGRLHAFAGNARASIAAFDNVHALNPHSYPAP